MEEDGSVKALAKTEPYLYLLKSQLNNSNMPCPPSPSPRWFTGQHSESVGLVSTFCLPSGRFCRVIWQRAWKYNSIRGRQYIVEKNNPVCHWQVLLTLLGVQTDLALNLNSATYLLPEILAFSNPSHCLWASSVPPIYLFILLVIHQNI